MESDVSLPHPSTNHGTGIDDTVPIHVAEQEQQEEMFNCDIKLLSKAYVSGFIARHVLHYIIYDDFATCLTSPTMLKTNDFIYFEMYKEDKHFVTYLSEKLVETVRTAISLLESKMAKVTHMGSVEGKITIAVMEAIDFGCIAFSGFSLQNLVGGSVRGIIRIAILWCKLTNNSVSEASRQRATKRKLTFLFHT